MQRENIGGTLEYEETNQNYPTPLNIQKFIPWTCLQWGTERPVTVIRIDEPPLTSTSLKDTNSKLYYKMSNKSTKLYDRVYGPETKPVEVSATYAGQHLVAVSIIDVDEKIPGKLIRAISLCLPFHKKLFHLTVRKAAVTCSVVHEISQMLPYSNITNICLDDSNVPEGNYDLLLQKTTQLTYLSLNRCNINDQVCNNIAMCLVYGRPAANSLRALELASNNITSKGFHYLGTMLRTNRILLHLNVADNKITDDTGRSLIVHLKEFPLSDEEKLTITRERLAKYKEEQQRESKTSKTDILENPNNPFSTNNLVVRNGSYYCKGNFTLCSLNLAYNNLYYPFLRILSDVVSYQEATVKSATGLIRIVIIGNNLPTFCDELVQLEDLLKLNIASRTTKISTLSVKSLTSRSKFKKS